MLQVTAALVHHAASSTPQLVLLAQAVPQAGQVETPLQRRRTTQVRRSVYTLNRATANSELAADFAMVN